MYYTRRSQPPVLSLMVEEHYTATANVSFVLSMLPYLVEEHDFWMRNRSVTVGNATLNQYRWVWSSLWLPLVAVSTCCEEFRSLSLLSHALSVQWVEPLQDLPFQITALIILNLCLNRSKSKDSVLQCTASLFSKYNVAKVACACLGCGRVVVKEAGVWSCGCQRAHGHIAFYFCLC